MAGLLQGIQDRLVCILRAACVLPAGVDVITVGSNRYRPPFSPLRDFFFTGAVNIVTMSFLADAVNCLCSDSCAQGSKERQTRTMMVQAPAQVSEDRQDTSFAWPRGAALPLSMIIAKTHLMMNAKSPHPLRMSLSCRKSNPAS